MKVLIIGAKGMLGQELAREFGETGYEILAWDKEEVDITKKDLVLEKIKSSSPEIIINAAAYNAVDKIEEGEKDFAEAVNGYAVGNLSEASEAIEATFIHYGTDYIFDGKEIDGYVEDATPNPQSVYAGSKLLGEQQIKNKKYYLIRTSRLFGKQAQSEGAKKSFVDVMLKCAEENDCLELVDEEISSPTYVFDLARRTREIIEWKKPFGIYHATNEGSCTWYGWAKKIFELSGKNKNIKLIPVGADKFPRAAKRPRYSILLNTKLPPMRRWEEALLDYLKKK
ncbi:MAG: dTDP-4-dehydrorhamnose reductase [Patescibacteria group bacterium]